MSNLFSNELASIEQLNQEEPSLQEILGGINIATIGGDYALDDSDSDVSNSDEPSITNSEASSILSDLVDDDKDSHTKQNDDDFNHELNEKLFNKDPEPSDGFNDALFDAKDQSPEIDTKDQDLGIDTKDQSPEIDTKDQELEINDDLFADTVDTTGGLEAELEQKIESLTVQAESRNTQYNSADIPPNQGAEFIQPKHATKGKKSIPPVFGGAGSCGFHEIQNFLQYV